MSKQLEKALAQDLIEFAGHSQDEVDDFLSQVAEVRSTKGDEAADALVKAASTKVKQATGAVPEAMPKTAEQKIAETLANRRTRNVGDKMVTEGSGFTENLGGKMKLNTPDVPLEKVAKHRAAKQLQKEAAERAFGGASKMLKGAGKLAKGGLKAIPLAGPAIVGGLTALATGDAQAGLGEALDSEALGEGSDEVGDMGLSRADLGIAERKGIDAQEEQELEDKSEQLKFLKGGEDAPDQEEELRGKRRKFNVLGE